MSKPADGDAVAVVMGAGGGVGAALVRRLIADGRFSRVLGFSRSSAPAIDLTDEASLDQAAAAATAAGALRLVIDATGFLHDGSQAPEKALKDLDAARLARSFTLNAIGPALMMKHLLPRLPRQGRSVFATLSARVGSIGERIVRAAHEVGMTLPAEMRASTTEDEAAVG